MENWIQTSFHLYTQAAASDRNLKEAWPDITVARWPYLSRIDLIQLKDPNVSSLIVFLILFRKVHSGYEVRTHHRRSSIFDW